MSVAAPRDTTDALGMTRIWEDRTAAVTKDELALLFIGAGHLWPRYDITYVSGKDINIGAVIGGEACVLQSFRHEEMWVWAVITQILRQCGVFLPPIGVVDKKGCIRTFDMRALIAATTSPPLAVASTSQPLISTSSGPTRERAICQTTRYSHHRAD
ncbi:hypothetical protein Bca52824_062156 [Brassica carinata]|uniref:Uncharacterized protein n=1 Tax=Brassica carinata TaxID=52824 RepID=A0A8X7U7X2_BRACI|nr:hypothetical protein Bca52824_062156 [Brassica carinata]